MRHDFVENSVSLERPGEVEIVDVGLDGLAGLGVEADSS